MGTEEVLSLEGAGHLAEHRCRNCLAYYHIPRPVTEDDLDHARSGFCMKCYREETEKTTSARGGGGS